VRDLTWRTIALAITTIGLVGIGTWSTAQEPEPKPNAPQAEKPEAEKPEAGKAAEEFPGPPPLENVRLLSTLPTLPVSRRDLKPFNVSLVDTSLLPRDPGGIWVLDFAYKPLRLRTIDVPGKGRRYIHYLYYRVINQTGEERMFIPQFVLLTDTGKRYEEAVVPQAVKIIQNREDPTIPLIGAVSVMGMIPPSKKKDVYDAIFGVAMFEGVDPRADQLHVYVRGLSDGHKDVIPPGGDKPVTQYKTLRIDFIRRGDHINIKESEIQPFDPPYEWIYW
jgi:hypothetical protein